MEDTLMEIWVKEVNMAMWIDWNISRWE
jgi:hypothetical protein